jgi:hypothetical protein
MTDENSTTNRCVGTFSGASGIWSAYVITCAQNAVTQDIECSYTISGTPGTDQLVVKSANVGLLNIPKYLNRTLQIIINCSNDILIVKSNDNPLYITDTTLLPNQILSEIVSPDESRSWTIVKRN